jgi:quinol monooxygenase YgiN
MTHIATYVDFDPKFTSQGIELLKKYEQLTGVEEGSTEVILLQEIIRQNRFVIVETWRDETAFKAHEAAAPLGALLRSTLKAIHNSPYDQRIHHMFSVERARSDLKGALCIVTHVDVPPPRKDETEVLLTKEAAESRTDEGNVRYDVFQQNAPRTNHFTVFAVWKDEQAFIAHQASAHTRGFREALGPMLGAPYDERLFERI